MGSSVPQDLREAVSDTFGEIQRNYLRREWKSVGVDAGHFVEAVRRVIEHSLFGKYTPIGKSLSSFSDKTLEKYLNSQGDESFRLLIPRQLWALYGLRNKRSMGHLGVTPAKQMDAHLLLNGAKWTVAELIRLTTDLPQAQAQATVDKVIEQQISPVWSEGEVVRILNPKVPARAQVLILLTLFGDMAEEQLRGIVEYKNATNFRKILRRLHEVKLIEYVPEGSKVSPTGAIEANQAIEKYAL